MRMNSISQNTEKEMKHTDQSYTNQDMDKISKRQYEFALARIEELLPLVGDDTPADDKNATELTLMSDIVIAYEKSVLSF